MIVKFKIAVLLIIFTIFNIYITSHFIYNQLNTSGGEK